MSGSAANEIEQWVAEALRARGVRARLELRDNQLSLAGDRALDIGGTVRQWPNLPEDLRRKRCAELAALLVEPAGPPPRPVRSARRFALPSVLAPLAILLSVAACIGFFYRKLAPPSVHAPSPSGATSIFGLTLPGAEPPRGCALARTRAAQGASLGPTDWDGWVIELVLLRPDGEPLSHEIDGFLTPATSARGARASWPAAPHLAQIDRFDAGVEIGDVRLSVGTTALRGLAFDFYGPYATPYFSQETRAEYVAFANALADRLSASYGALYAHCQGEHDPHLGGWFRGPSPTGALAALIYFTGALGHSPALDAPNSAAPDSLGGLQKALGTLDRAAAATELASSRAVVSGRANTPTSLTFPFREGDLATRAALAVARNHHLR